MMDRVTLKPERVHLELRSFAADLVLPPGTDILRTSEPEALADVPAAIAEVLARPIGSAPLVEMCRQKLDRVGDLRVVVVVSDNTRPAPYRGENGMLWPLVELLVAAGLSPGAITVLVATGTHRSLTTEEIWVLLDERVRRAGVRVSCHDATDRERLVRVGRSARGVEVSMNREFVEADFRILTGLVEPHLMAGVSGGRKSICPGLLDVESVREFHGPATLAHEKATDLILEGNPCHEVSLEIAEMARADFILNATIRQDGGVAGVFAGDMVQAHLAAVEHVRSFAQIPLSAGYDVVVTHAGLVGVNHYQAEKAAAVAAKAVNKDGFVIVIADTTEPDPVGTQSYRRMLRLMADIGPDAFVRTIMSEDWQFVHDQWGVQVWAKLFADVPREHVFYFSPQTALEDYAILPGVHPGPLLSGVPGGGQGGPGARVAGFVAAAVAQACEESEKALGRRPSVAYLADGPHGIPIIGT